MRPTIDFKDDLGAVLRYHCTKVGISIAGYVKGLVYDDLLNKYPNLLDETKKKLPSNSSWRNNGSFTLKECSR